MQLESNTAVFIHVLGFIVGNVLFIVISLSYFFSTNKSIFELLHLTEGQNAHKKSRSLAQGIIMRFNTLNRHLFRDGEFYVDTYLTGFFKVSWARESKHYDRSILSVVYAQNHINASVFEFLVIVTIVALGIFRDIDEFQIPAGASIILLFSMILMIFSAIYSWFKHWASFIIILLLIIFSAFSSKNILYQNKANGLKYSGAPAKYNQKNIYSLLKDTTTAKKDYFHHLGILQKWKEKNTYQSGRKPKIIFINCSGGGLRSAMWSFYSLAYLDSFIGNDFSNKIHLITGASGGMFGAAYYRELYHQKQKNPSLHIASQKYIDNISKDLLNPIGFSIAVHDILFSFDKYFNKNNIIKDRAYAFEKQFNKNTENILNKTLYDYMAPEANAEIPMMFFSPTIVNDVRKLQISAQPIGFMMQKTKSKGKIENEYSADNIEFTKLFKKHDAYKLNFVTALRMNGTFPYILPDVALPTEPMIEVLDAGLRDNFGLESTLNYIQHFEDWLAENTSGVIVLQLRDKFKNEIGPEGFLPDFNSEVSPLSAIFQNVTVPHNYIQDNQVGLLNTKLKVNVQVIKLQLHNLESDKISLSWHLTQKEKGKILKSMHLSENESAIYKIISLLQQE